MNITVSGSSAYVYTGGMRLSPKTPEALPAIVFIHGAQQDHSCWGLQSRWFGHHGFSALAPDLPGHGKSAGSALFSIESLAAWVVALLDTLKIRAAHIVGHSMGSLVGMELAVCYPGRVLSLSLIGSALPMPVAPVLLEAARDNEPAASRMINNWSYSPAAQLGGSRMPGLWMLGMNERLMAHQKPGVFHADLLACNAYARPMESLSGIKAPALVIAGAEDKMTPPKIAQALAFSIPHAQFAVLPGSGHALMAERPDEVLDHLRDFVTAV